jgi:hypothetical protein
MAEIALHLVNDVIPEVPVRQWVLSVPFPLRYVLAYDAELCSQVLGIFVRAVFDWLRQTAMSELKLPDGTKLHCGAITCIQRAGGAANLNLHYHTAVLDGVYVQQSPDAPPRFRALRGPNRAEVLQIAWTVCQRVTKLMQRRGIYFDGDPGDDKLTQEEPLLAACAAGSLQNRQVLGPRAGQQVLALRTLGANPVAPESGSAAKENTDGEDGGHIKPAHGFDVHAGLRVPAHERKRLTRLLRYMLRPALSDSRLTLLPDGRVRLMLQRPWNNGTRYLVFDPVDFLARLVPLIPPPRVHQVVAHGVLAPNARLRAQISPCRSEDASGPRPPKQLELPGTAGTAREQRAAAAAAQDTPENGAGPRRRRYVPWAELMKRSLELDPLECPQCGKQMRVVASVKSAESIRAILAARNIQSDARKANPARAPPQLCLPFAAPPLKA